MYKIGDYAVCPGHGVGQVVDIEIKEVGGSQLHFYIVRVLANGMTVMVPTSSKDGIRSLVSEEEVSDVYDLLEDHDVKVDNSTWNRRYREYMNKIKTGSIIEIAEVLRALFLLKSKKNLSFGEKKMLDQCRDLISREISLTSGKEIDQVNNQIDNCFE